MKPNSTQDAFNVMFIITSMPIGGAETLLVNMIRRMDPQRCKPFVCCLKEPGVLGEQISDEFPVFYDLIRHKFDVGVVGRISSLLKEHKIDAVITVGAGDKMFWGRLAAKRARVPVILSALHSTGWPDGISRLNRVLTPITDGFIAVAQSHGDFLVEMERLPADKVFVIPNGVDTDRFQRDQVARSKWRSELGISPEAPVVSIVAALRPEKNHRLFLETAHIVNQSLPETQYLIAGDGPIREELTELAHSLQIGENVRFLGSVHDIPGVLSASDLFALTSDNEASPVSILEAMSCSLPVVATDVGSVSQSVHEGQTGFLVPTQYANASASAWLKVLSDPQVAHEFGQRGRTQVLQNSSLQAMTDSYQDLIAGLFQRKVLQRADTHELQELSVLSSSTGCVSQ